MPNIGIQNPLPCWRLWPMLGMVRQTNSRPLCVGGQRRRVHGDRLVQSGSELAGSCSAYRTCCSALRRLSNDRPWVTCADDPEETLPLTPPTLLTAIPFRRQASVVGQLAHKSLSGDVRRAEHQRLRIPGRGSEPRQRDLRSHLTRRLRGTPAEKTPAHCCPRTVATAYADTWRCRRRPRFPQMLVAVTQVHPVDSSDRSACRT